MIGTVDVFYQFTVITYSTGCKSDLVTFAMPCDVTQIVECLASAIPVIVRLAVSNVEDDF